MENIVNKQAWMRHSRGDEEDDDLDSIIELPRKHLICSSEFL